jgi:uncharacterized protein (TIGR02444 family)
MNDNVTSFPFWEFSLKLYQNNLIKTFCLDWQNRYQMNVNIILYACWLAHTDRGFFVHQDLVDIHGFVSDWHESVTKELRKIRTTVKNSQNNFKWREIGEESLKNELYAEYVEQWMLCSYHSKAIISPRTISQKSADLQRSLLAYANFQQIILSEQDQHTLQQCIVIVFI